MNDTSGIGIGTRATRRHLREKWHALLLKNGRGTLYIRHRQRESINALVVDGRRVSRLGIERRQPLQQAEAMMVTSINGHIGTPVSHRLIKTPGSRFFKTERLLVNPADVGVTKTLIKDD